MPGLCGLNRVHRERADGVDGQLNDFVIRHKDSFPCVLSLSMFQRGHLAQPSQVSVGLSEFGSEKRLDQIPRQFLAFDASAQTDDVEVVVLDALLRRKMVLNQTSADALDLVCANRRADAATANRHTTIHRVGGHCLPKWNDEV